MTPSNRTVSNDIRTRLSVPRRKLHIQWHPLMKQPESLFRGPVILVALGQLHVKVPYHAAHDEVQLRPRKPAMTISQPHIVSLDTICLRLPQTVARSNHERYVRSFAIARILGIGFWKPPLRNVCVRLHKVDW